MASEQLVFIDDRLDRRQVPDLMPLGVGGVGLQIATTATAAFGITRCDGGALFAGDQFSRVPLVAFLSTLFSFFSRRLLSLRLGMRMHGARRNRGIARGQFLDLCFCFIQSFKQRNNERFDGRRHFDFEFGRYLAHASIGTEIDAPSPDRFANSLHRLVNGYLESKQIVDHSHHGSTKKRK